MFIHTNLQTTLYSTVNLRTLLMMPRLWYYGLLYQAGLLFIFTFSSFPNVFQSFDASVSAIIIWGKLDVTFEAGACSYSAMKLSPKKATLKCIMHLMMQLFENFQILFY